jgi:hypothetical protein
MAIIEKFYGSRVQQDLKILNKIQRSSNETGKNLDPLIGLATNRLRKDISAQKNGNGGTPRPLKSR